jgi:CheY-like chemotaxis protein
MAGPVRCWRWPRAGHVYASMAGPFRATDRGRSAETKRPLICVVEDNEDNRTLMTAVLRRGGMDIVEVGDDQALDEVLARAVVPDLFIVDISLPREGAAALLRRLRSDPRWASRPILACTAHAMAGDAERGLVEGFDAYLTKPVDIGTVASVVAGFLGGGRRPHSAP